MELEKTIKVNIDPTRTDDLEELAELLSEETDKEIEITNSGDEDGWRLNFVITKV